MNFFLLDESTKLISAENNGQQTLKRTLSNESEPFDSFEEKELSLQLNERTFVRTISEESLPQEMLEDVVDGTDNSEVDFFDAKTDMKSWTQVNFILLAYNLLHLTLNNFNQ